MRKINLHKEHRKRVRERYSAEGLKNFSLHNIVEFLLFFAIPQKDTNETAHKLVNRYKTLSNILDADYNDLLTNDGIGEYSATFIKLLPDLFRAYSMDKVPLGMVCDTVENTAEFFIRYYTTVTKEVVVLVLLNNRNEIIECAELHEGSLNSSVVNVDKIVEIVYSRRAANFILAHNHPDGNPEPSYEDIMTTKTITNVFSMLSVKLLEHYIISGTRYRTVINDNK
jgi:DNA repair proteins